jgi:hypothetical protein
LIGPSQSASNRFDECSVPLKTKLPGFGVEMRLVRDERQLVLNEGTERLSDKVELPRKLLVGPAQPVEPDPEPFVEFGGPAAIEPCAKGVGEDRGLRRAWLARERFELVRQVVGQVKLMPSLEGLHVANSGAQLRLAADASGRTLDLLNESRSDLGSGALPSEGPGDVPAPHDSGHLFADLALKHRAPRHEREFTRVLNDRHAHRSNLH